MKLIQGINKDIVKAYYSFRRFISGNTIPEELYNILKNFEVSLVRLSKQVDGSSNMYEC